MALENKKLSTYADLASANIDTTTKLVVLTGATKVNANLPVTNFIEDSLTSTSVVKPLSAKKGKELKTLIDDKVPSTNGINGQVLIGADDNVNGWQTPTKSLVGLSNVDNTSDVNKPVSTATQTALNSKADTANLDSKRNIVIPIRTNGIGWDPADAESVVYMTTNAANFLMDIATTPPVGAKVIVKNGNIAGCTINGSGITIDGVDRDADSGIPLALSTAYNSITLMYTGSSNFITI